jgi:hypothetical protein
MVSSMFKPQCSCALVAMHGGRMAAMHALHCLDLGPKLLYHILVGSRLPAHQFLTHVATGGLFRRHIQLLHYSEAANF